MNKYISQTVPLKQWLPDLFLQSQISSHSHLVSQLAQLNAVRSLDSGTHSTLWSLFIIHHCLSLMKETTCAFQGHLYIYSTLNICGHLFFSCLGFWKMTAKCLVLLYFCILSMLTKKADTVNKIYSMTILFFFAHKCNKSREVFQTDSTW